MKVSVLLNVFLAAAVAVLAVAKFAPESSSKTDNPVIDNIMTRTSIRAYETKKVEEKKIEVLGFRGCRRFREIEGTCRQSS